MMTTDKLWQAYVDEKMCEVARHIENRVRYAARGTSLGEYEISRAVQEALQFVRDGVAEEG